ncbi:MAG: hypothetical protein WBS22_11410 [Methylocystis sp.]
MKRAFLIVALLALAANAHAANLPLNPDVTQQNIDETICVRGWTKTVRPPFEVTNAIKLNKLRERGLTEADKSRFELDHVIPLALGGAPDDPRNLRLEPWPEADRKDGVEACLAHAVCAGRISLNEARRRIWKDWRAARKACAARRSTTAGARGY